MIFFKAWVAWCVMALMAVANGALREKYINARMGEQTGHIISSVTLSMAVILVTYAYLTIMGPLTLHILKLIGLFWVLVSILFEFFFGHFVMGNTWSQLIADYNIFRGRIWLLVLGSQAVAPVVVGWILGYWS